MQVKKTHRHFLDPAAPTCGYFSDSPGFLFGLRVELPSSYTALPFGIFLCDLTHPLQATFGNNDVLPSWIRVFLFSFGRGSPSGTGSFLRALRRPTDFRRWWRTCAHIFGIIICDRSRRWSKSNEPSRIRRHSLIHWSPRVFKCVLYLGWPGRQDV